MLAWKAIGMGVSRHASLRGKHSADSGGCFAVKKPAICSLTKRMVTGSKLELMKRCTHVLVVWNLEFTDLLERPALGVRCKAPEFLQVVV